MTENILNPVLFALVSAAWGWSIETDNPALANAGFMLFVGVGLWVIIRIPG